MCPLPLLYATFGPLPNVVVCTFMRVWMGGGKEKQINEHPKRKEKNDSHLLFLGSFLFK